VWQQVGAWVLDHIPSLVAAVGALYASRKVAVIEVNTNSRLCDLIAANENLRTTVAQLVAAKDKP
jgi:hypothetical protein